MGAGDHLIYCDSDPLPTSQVILISLFILTKLSSQQSFKFEQFLFNGVKTQPAIFLWWH
jgi:hypothetical protein